MYIKNRQFPVLLQPFLEVAAVQVIKWMSGSACFAISTFSSDPTQKLYIHLMIV